MKGETCEIPFLVVSVAHTETNARVFEEAEMLQTFCNAVDDIDHCNCYASAVVRRGPLQIAISTAGKSPALAQRLREELEERFGEEYAKVSPTIRTHGDRKVGARSSSPSVVSYLCSSALDTLDTTAHGVE
jgi:precorrin-2 dehydrogenase